MFSKLFGFGGDEAVAEPGTHAGEAWNARTDARERGVTEA